ncbi:MAG: hypothetical protein CJBNEKGG_03121 [Prosthecobacter sp.]|nr:hypothetical protein [Prosthecobacter sp.]
MASKPTPKKGAAKKAAVVKKSAPAKAASKGSAAPKKAVKPAPKAARPAPRPSAKPAPKQTKPPAPKTAAKAAPSPAPAVVKPAPVAPPPAPAPVPSPSPKPAVKAPAQPASGALTISVQSSQGMAANGNTHPANLLVIVTCAGVPVVELSKDHFTLMEHFEVPGQTAPFSNNITSFRNAGTGAYLLQVKPITGAPWRSGHHLGQLLISDDDERQGQAAFKLIIR